MQPHEPGRISERERAEELRRFRNFAEWMDRRYVDPLLGLLLPGAGDALGTLAGLYGLWVALRLSAHPVVIARMLVNLSIDALLGAVPLLGPIADFFYRANLKNLALLEARRDPRVTGRDYLVVGFAALLFLIALVLPVLLIGWLIYWLWGRLGPALMALGS